MFQQELKYYCNLECYIHIIQGKSVQYKIIALYVGHICWNKIYYDMM